jgi:hypothetical protein
MGQLDVDAGGDQEIAEPVPAPGRFHHRLVRPGKLGEILAQERAVVRQRHLRDLLARRSHGGEDRGVLVLIDAGIEHAPLLAGVPARYLRSGLETSRNWSRRALDG